METSCFLDFCLRCDRQTPPDAGNYCSERCRLADLDVFPPTFQPPSPDAHKKYQAQPARSYPSFPLQPAFDFAAWRVPTTTDTIHSHSLTASTSHNKVDLSTRTLATSSSQSSLSSLGSDSSRNSMISESARVELRIYANSFDMVRRWRRRMSTRQ